MGCFQKINAFLVFSKCFHKTVHNKWCLDKVVGQIENDLERGFVNHWLNYVLIFGPVFYIENNNNRNHNHKNNDDDDDDDNDNNTTKYTSYNVVVIIYYCETNTLTKCLQIILSL